MSKIIFAIKWNDIKQKNITWSGTPYGLLTSLKHRISNNRVIELSIDYSMLDSFMLKLSNKFYNMISVDNVDMLQRIIESKKVDRIITDNSDDPIIVFSETYTKRLSDTYVFLDCSFDYAYRSYISNYEFSQFVPYAKNKKRSLISRRNRYAMKFYRNCRGIFTMGEWLKKDLIENTGISSSKVHCVGGGCNIDIKKIDDSQKQGNKFLFVGKDFERKNGELVLKAFKKLSENNPGKYQLYIAGPKTWPSKEPITDGVVFLGLKNTTELVEYYNMCDVFVMPSQFEAYGIVFGEALIYGLPCIGRNAFSMKDFIQDGKNGYLLNSKSVDELSDLMKTAITNSNMRNQVISDRDMYIDLYSWNTVVDKILKAIRNDGYGF